MRREQVIIGLYRELRRRLGAPAGQWSAWCKRPKTIGERELVIIEAILTQRTNWRNVELAMRKLRAVGLIRIKSLARTRISGMLREAIRSSGFYRSKAQYLVSLARFIQNRGGVRALMSSDGDPIRQELLALPGIGPETADSILLYALDMPVFVIDEYTRRLLARKRIVHGTSYEAIRELFERSIRKEYRLYQDFHALIVIDGKLKNRK